MFKDFKGAAHHSALAVCALLCACAAAHAQSAARESGFAEVNGTRLYYEAAGKGPAVVLVHGGLVDSRLWDAQMKPLSKRFRVVRYDLRGYGRSAAPTAKFSPLEDLRALLDYLKVDKASLVGLSLGGMIAADFALEYPARVERLVLVDAGLRGDKQPPDEKSLNAYRTGAREGAEKYFEAFTQADLLAGVRDRPKARAAMHAMMVENFKALTYLSSGLSQSPEPPTIERLGQIKAPTLVVVGGIDGKNLQNIADTLAARIPGARKVVIPGASHHPPVETPEEFNRVLLDYLAEGRRRK
ncbi:MAG TPA: alpha/beta fold hydrolase [Pyrinomonadaceae bacterium]|nr:alpha/beta fold hydrolase [Pyrinomonadaceae bacterium]